MWALVRYLKCKTHDSVPVNYVKDYLIEPIKVGTVRKVFWTDGEKGPNEVLAVEGHICDIDKLSSSSSASQTVTGYYSADILLLAETEDKLSEMADAKRVPQKTDKAREIQSRTSGKSKGNGKQSQSASAVKTLRKKGESQNLRNLADNEEDTTELHVPCTTPKGTSSNATKDKTSTKEDVAVDLSNLAPRKAKLSRDSHKSTKIVASDNEDSLGSDDDYGHVKEYKEKIKELNKRLKDQDKKLCKFSAIIEKSSREELPQSSTKEAELPSSGNVNVEVIERNTYQEVSIINDENRKAPSPVQNLDNGGENNAGGENAEENNAGGDNAEENNAGGDNAEENNAGSDNAEGNNAASNLGHQVFSSDEGSFPLSENVLRLIEFSVPEEGAAGDSIFTKSAAAAVFGRGVLATHSMTGEACRANPSLRKPALPKDKLDYVRSLLLDRIQSRKRPANMNEQDEAEFKAETGRRMKKFNYYIREKAGSEAARRAKQLKKMTERNGAS